ncbi:MAG TPA: enoyl-CoA hydratase-related protein [Acidimicrobiales bacterium]|nr:enoyl-CoA hydratase-related protein [Acidimicrobiales bacterium]
MGSVSFSVDGGVATITLQRPEAGNAIDLALAQELRAAVLDVERDASVRVVVLRGAGANFCVGGDLRAFADREDLPAHLREVTTHLHAAIVGLARIDAPIVVAVQGSAAGAGLGLVCGGDLVVAEDAARFVVAYSRVGLSPDGGTSWFLPRLVGLRRAQELALTNQVLDAPAAQAAGIVTRVVRDGDLQEEVVALAAALAAGPARAVGEAKRLLRASFDQPLAVHLDAEAAALVRSAAQPDAAEGIAAFLAKRAARFSRG